MNKIAKHVNQKTPMVVEDITLSLRGLPSLAITNEPMTTEEIAQTALACHRAGADEIHLHVRDDKGMHSLDVERYRNAIDAVKDIAPLIGVQITTESAGIFDVSDQFRCLSELRPRAASISVRELAQDEKMASRIYDLCLESETVVQHIICHI